MDQMMQKDRIKSHKKSFFMKNIAGLKEVEKGLYESILDSDGLTHEICVDLIESGGKRIRPLLVLCTAQCFGPLNEQAIQTGIASELIHMASLVHDDIIDRSTMRRNRPTVNARMGSQISVLVGDYLFAKTFKILSENRLLESMNLLVEAIQQMCDGEISQDRNKYNLDQTVEDYYEKIYKKTGILICSCCKAGAIVGRANEEEVKALEIYGKNLGYAFQIIDDLLDFVGDEKILGKPVASDLNEGNITLPIIKLIKDEEYKVWLEKILKEENTKKHHDEILRLLKDSYALDESYDEAVNCIEHAKKALGIIKDSDYKELLIDIADRVLTRKN